MINSINNTLLSSLDMSKKVQNQQNEKNTGFAELLTNSLDKLNGQYNKVNGMTNAALLGDQNININSISVPAAEFDLSLNLVKAVLDRAISAYNNLISLK